VDVEEQIRDRAYGDGEGDGDGTGRGTATGPARRTAGSRL
jgi:hypothetical protein